MSVRSTRLTRDVPRPSIEGRIEPTESRVRLHEEPTHLAGAVVGTDTGWAGGFAEQAPPGRTRQGDYSPPCPTTPGRQSLLTSAQAYSADDGWPEGPDSLGLPRSPQPVPRLQGDAGGGHMDDSYGGAARPVRHLSSLAAKNFDDDRFEVIGSGDTQYDGTFSTSHWGVTGGYTAYAHGSGDRYDSYCQYSSGGPIISGSGRDTGGGGGGDLYGVTAAMAYGGVTSPHGFNDYSGQLLSQTYDDLRQPQIPVANSAGISRPLYRNAGPADPWPRAADIVSEPDLWDNYHSEPFIHPSSIALTAHQSGLNNNSISELERDMMLPGGWGRGDDGSFGGEAAAQLTENDRQHGGALDS